MSDETDEVARQLFTQLHDAISDMEWVIENPGRLLPAHKNWPESYRRRAEQFHIVGGSCADQCVHDSDCATHSAPAEPTSPCDCPSGGLEREEHA